VIEPYQRNVPLGWPWRPTSICDKSPTPTITKPDLDDVRDVKPKAPRPYKVVVLD